ncbi:MAG: DUF2142 domain-containing protein [Terriglobales bacterium]|jgi:hypothetical protein
MVAVRTGKLRQSERVGPRKPRTASPSKFNERHLVLALCCLAAIRVFVYSAAFPFFNNVDEGAHFDLVLKYSHGLVPRQLDLVSVEASNYMTLYGSPEYLLKPQQFPNRKFPPPIWTASEQAKAAMMARRAAARHPNTESSQAPLYYAAAALWLHLGQLFGVSGGFLLYWIRFLNVFLAAALVWLGFAAARLVFPEGQFVRLGVPVLLAVLPQDIFYSIQNDVLSPLCFGMAFIALVRWLRADVPSRWLGLCTGLSLAAVCLVKVSNLPLVAVAAVAVLVQAWRLARAGKLRAAALALTLLLLSAALPIACWAAWNLHNFGDLTGSGPKIAMLGWTRKPVGEWLHHPIFTLRGIWYFWSALMASFWRGEFVWGMQRLAWPAVDAFYWISSAVLAGIAMVGLFPRFAPASKPQREALWLALSAFIAAVGYLALLSIVFDYGKCFYPSRANPYFVSGRLLAGALIPFFLIYLYGLEWAAKRLKCEALLWWILAAMVVLMAGSQIALDRVAFSSPWNWFHLLGG